MQIIEGSDTQLTFKITETAENGTTTPVDLTDYDEVRLTIALGGIILDIEGEIDQEDDSTIIFDLLSEQTKGRSWEILADIRGLQGAKKIRFNKETIQGTILHSIKVPQWATDL